MGRAVMVRNPDWWGFECYSHNLDRIEFTQMTDPEARLAALIWASRPADRSAVFGARSDQEAPRT